eukprot:GFKZ01012160.1.p1 GENE.GFKZ01012160.1~~GFKZ01012160.1.p1  ORF type:complete len:238 (-),score=20.17 GFKZ01012160.1:1955-2668(-)
MWSVMLRRHLGVRVYDDTAPLRCAACEKRMDALGDHASDLCNKGHGWNTRHRAVYITLGRELFSAAGLNVRYEVPNLVPGLNVRPADILVTERQDGSSPLPPLPVAYDVTVVSPFQRTTKSVGAKAAGAVALAAEKRKVADLARKLAAVPGQALPGRSRLGWRFVPLGFDSLGAPSESTSKVIDEHAVSIATRNGTSPGKVKNRLYQKLSYAIWSTCAASIINRAPQHAELPHPIPI